MFIVVAVEEVNVMNNVDTCVMCGIIVPEGRQVCPTCEDKASQKPIKQDFSKQCNMNDDDERNNCWSCIHFCFPIGCMFGEE